MRFKVIYLTIFSLFAVVKSVSALEICGELKQGELVLIKDADAQKIRMENNFGVKSYRFGKDGTALVALHRDAPKKIKFAAIMPHDFADVYEIEIVPATWDIQRINGVAQSKVTPTSEADLKEIRREQRDLGRAVTYYESGEAWRNGFIVPVEGRISGHFGNQRVFNGVPKNPHTGTDIAAPEGTPVRASGDGTVLLSGKDYFYTGNMVVIDHGYGLQTIYAHLQKATVKKGDAVKKGDVIGYVGKTGRATGAHLHWGASLNNVRFRPHSLLDINDKQCIVYQAQ